MSDGDVSRKEASTLQEMEEFLKGETDVYVSPNVNISVNQQTLDRLALQDIIDWPTYVTMSLRQADMPSHVKEQTMRRMKSKQGQFGSGLSSTKSSERMTNIIKSVMLAQSKILTEFSGIGKPSAAAAAAAAAAPKPGKDGAKGSTNKNSSASKENKTSEKNDTVKSKEGDSTKKEEHTPKSKEKKEESKKHSRSDNDDKDAEDVEKKKKKPKSS